MIRSVEAHRSSHEDNVKVKYDRCQSIIFGATNVVSGDVADVGIYMIT